MSSTTRGKRKRPIHDIYETSENVEESQRSRRRINGGGRVTPSKSNTQTPQSYKSNELASLLNSSDDEEQDDDIAPSNNKNNNDNSKNDNNTSFGIRSRSRDSSRRRRQTSIYTNKFNQNDNNNNNENSSNNNNNNSNNDSKDIEEETSTTTAVKTTSEIVYPKLVKTSLKSNNKKSKLAVGATTLKKRKLKSKRNDVLSNDENENENEREHKESSPKSEKYSKKRGSTDNGKNNDNNKKRKTAQSAKKAKKAAKSRNSFENEFETVHTSDLVTLLSSSPSSESDNDNNQNKERDKDGEGEDSSIETSPNYNKDDENDNDNENENQDRAMPDRKRKKPLTTKPPRSAERDPSNLHDNDKNKGEKSKRRHSLMDNDRNEDNEYNEEMELEGMRNEGNREGFNENDNDSYNDRGRRNSKATTTRTRATFYTTHSHSRGRNNNVAARGVGGARSTSRPRSHLLNKNKNKDDNGSQIVQGHSRNSGIFSQNIRDDSRKELRHGLLPMPEPRSGSSMNHSTLNNESQIVNLTNFQDNNSFAHRKHELNLHSDPRSNIQSRLHPQRQGYMMEPGSPQHQQHQQQQRKRRRQTENWGNKYDNNDNDRNRNDEYDSSETESDDNDDDNNIGPQLIGRGARNSLSPRRKPLGMNSPTNTNRDFNKSNIIGAQFMVPPNAVGNMNIHRRHSTMQQQHQHQPQTQRPTSLLGQRNDIDTNTNGMNSPIIRTFESDNNNNNLDRSFNMSNRFFHSPKSISAMKRRRPIVINPNGSPTKLNFDGTGDDNDNGNDSSGIEYDNGGIPSFLTTAVCFFYENPRLGAFGNTIAWIIVIFWNIYRFKFVIFSLIVFYAFYIIFCDAFSLSTFRDFLSFMASLFLAKPIIYCDYPILNDPNGTTAANCQACPIGGFCSGGQVRCQDGMMLIDGECRHSPVAINEMEAKIPRLIAEILTKRRGMYECYDKYQLWPSCIDLNIAVDFDQSLTCQLDDNGDKRVFPIKSMEMKRNDLKVKLAHLLKVETTNFAFEDRFTEEITRLMQQTGEYKAELKRVADLIAKEQIKEKHNVFDDVIAQAERMERNNQENEEFNRKEQKATFDEIKEHEKRRMELQKMQERVKEPLIMYNAQDGTLYATIGKKTVKCLIYDWCYEHVLLLVFIMFSIYWISRWTYRRNKFAKQKKKVNQIKHEILLFLKQRRHHNPPYVSIEQAKIHCVPIRFDDTIWEMAKEAVENDPNVQKSTRAIDGVQRTCWKISQTAFLHD